MEKYEVVCGSCGSKYGLVSDSPEGGVVFSPHCPLCGVRESTGTSVRPMEGGSSWFGGVQIHPPAAEGGK